MVRRFVRIGSLVLLVHDLSDVLLEGAKLCKYGGRETAASVTFGFFALSFLLLRLVYYPLVLIYSTRWGLILSSNPQPQASFPSARQAVMRTAAKTSVLSPLYWEQILFSPLYRVHSRFCSRLSGCPHLVDLQLLYM